MRNLKSTKLNQTVHRVVLDDNDLKTLVAEAVANAACVDLLDARVSVKTNYITTSHREGRGTEASATVEIVVDHTVEASPCPN